MIGRLTSIFPVPRAALHRGYLFPKSKYGDLGETPGLVAKRLIDVVGRRLREIDPARWETVPITFKTHWKDENGYSDIRTCIMVHDAIEREFGIDIIDRAILINDFEQAYYVVMQSHDAV